MPENSNGTKYVSSKMFIALYILVFTVILAAITVSCTVLAGQNEQISKNREDISDVQGDIKAIKTDTANISKSIDEIKSVIKR